MRASIENSGAAFALAGSCTNAAPKEQGSRGIYWSSTRINYESMHYMYLDASNVYPAGAYGRLYGGAIRCVAK